MGASGVIEAMDLRRELEAFGETKTIEEWSLDPRARVWGGAILERLAEGMAAEQAIALPLPQAEAGPAQYLAFGERKTLRDWADDVRSEVALHTLRARLKLGWAIETALTTPARAKGPRRDLGLVEAFGEAKTVEEWARDPRAGTTAHNIRVRLHKGRPAEEAVSKPTGNNAGRMVEAFGETKPIRQWVRDPRVRAHRNAIAQRLDEGMAPETALTLPTHKFAKPGLTAFGETKTLEEWTKDPRCTVSEATLVKRRREGMALDDAVTRPSSFNARVEEAAIRPKGLPSHTHCLTAFGETKSLNAWSKDPRCSVGGPTLKRRLEEGMAPEEAITTGRRIPANVSLTAFGETKTMQAWLADARCVVGVAASSVA